jgi:hypothetical protein
MKLTIKAKTSLKSVTKKHKFKQVGMSNYNPSNEGALSSEDLQINKDPSE